MTMGLMANAQCYRDVVYLNNGSIIKGQITELDPKESLRIETSDGSIFVLDINDVSKCEKEIMEVSSNNFSKEKNISLYPTRGYRGFAELSYLPGKYMAEDERSNRVVISTSHGCQINPNLYLGGGIAEEIEIYWEDACLAVFGDICYNFKKQKNSMFVDLRAGTYFYDAAYLFFNANIGYRFKNINLSIGYELAPYDYYDGWSYLETQYTSSLVFKIGFDWGSRK